MSNGGRKHLSATANLMEINMSSNVTKILLLTHLAVLANLTIHRDRGVRIAISRIPALTPEVRTS